MYVIPRNFFEHFYNKLPAVYRIKDADTGYTLKKYLEAIVEAGYSPMLKAIVDVADLLDPERCPSEFLPFLCRTFGIEYSPNIAEIYQRKFLKNFIELNIRKGTESCVKYIARELSGYDAEVRVEGKEVIIDLVVFEDEKEIQTTQAVIEDYISKYVPAGMTVTTFIAYYYVELLNYTPYSLDTELLTTIDITTNYLTPTIICKEEENNSIIEVMGVETYDGASDGMGITSLTNTLSSEPQWFYTNAFSIIDIVNTSEGQEIIFN